jgi:acetyl esterase
MTGASPSSGWRRAVLRAGLAGLRASLLVSPRPMVWLIRRQFAESGRQLADSLRAHRPANVTMIVDDYYDGHPDARLDVSYPENIPTDTRLPTVVWTHGGAFVAGDKSETNDYFRLIAASGLTVVGINYTLAPRGRYPTPVRQLMTALQYLQANADRYHVDPGQIVLAGDSAGAHIAAQAATAITNPECARRLGVTPTIQPEQLRGVALCCGIFYLSLVSPDSPVKDFIGAVAWAYSGTRDYRSNESFMSGMDIPSQATESFPSSFVTVGNVDPLRSHSRALVSALQAHGVETDVLLFPDDHQPALGHEYQFNIDAEDAETALQRLISFVHARTTGPCSDPNLPNA